MIYKPDSKAYEVFTNYVKEVVRQGKALNRRKLEKDYTPCKLIDGRIVYKDRYGFYYFEEED